MAHLAFHPPGSSPEPPGEGRLDSWKEIAAYLRRDVRTVQRWEKSEGLPVRRHQHDSLGSVYAYRHELDAWREGRQPALGLPEAAIRGRRHLKWAAIGVLVVLASAGVVATRPLRNGHGTVPIVLRTVQLTNDQHLKGPGLAVDESRVYFGERLGESLAVSAVPTTGGEPETVAIPLTSPVILDVLPDGSEMLVLDTSVSALEENLVYVHPLYRVPMADGTPRRVGDVMADCASWLPDRRTILYAVGRHLKRVDRDGTASRTLATLPGALTTPRVAPDGRTVRFSVVDPRNQAWSLWETTVDGATPRPILPGWDHGPDGVEGSWSPEGDYFFLSGHGGTPGVWFLPGKTWLGPGARPTRLTAIPFSAGAVLVGRAGRRIFQLAGLCSGDVLRWDAGSRQFVPHPARIPGSMVDFTRDGASIVYVAFPSFTLWRARADGTGRQQLTGTPLEVAQPRWSPDGTRVAFQARSPGQTWRIFAIPSSGGEAAPLADGAGEETDPTWSPDGRRLLFAHALGQGPGARLTLRVLDLATGQTSELPGTEGKFSPRWSPDGRHVAALPADWQKLLVLDLETGRWWEPATGDLGFPTWSRDGTHLYFQTRDDVVQRLRLLDGRTEIVASRKGLPRSYTFCGAWFGLDPEDRVLVMRDLTVAEVFAFDYAYR